MNPRLHSCLLFIVLCCSYIDAQERCFNPRNRQGICVNIRNCPQMISILRKPRPLSQEDLDFLRSSQCGFEGDHPKVCCENAAQEPIPTPTTPTPTPTPIDDPSRITTIPDPPDVTNHPNLRIINPEGCGHITESKLLGGNKTGVAEFPWMALIAYDVGRANPEFRCGGTAISKRYVLTAAHCITGLSGIKLVGVRLGDHDLRTERDCDKDGDGLETVCAERYQDFGVESSVPHPGYTKSVLHDDVGLIRLNADADFRPINVRPICLPVGGAAGAQLRRVTVTGWGATETGRRSPDLLKINISPVPNEQCAQNYKRSRVNVWHKQLCAGGTKDVDSCQGDSGGPLQSPGSQNGNLRWIQYGIVSFGPKDCGIEGFPGVYTRVSYYLDWILDNMRD